MRYYIQDELSQDYYYTTITELRDFFYEVVEEYGPDVEILASGSVIIIK